MSASNHPELGSELPNPELGQDELRTKLEVPQTDKSKKKTIKAPGIAVARTAQACDRCRAKKSKCDGKLPACSSCAAVGIKCIVSDKLSRRAFPKGYTETLEERVRQLEAENNKLQGLLTLRDEQLALNAPLNGQASASEPEKPPKQVSPDLSNPYSVLHSHNHDEGCLCCSDSHAMHERPVSLAGSVYEGGSIYDYDGGSVPGSVYGESVGSVFSDDDNSFLSADTPNRPYSKERDYLKERHPKEQNFSRGQFSKGYSSKERPAPGAFAAATAIEQMQKKRTNQHMNEDSKQQILTGLVAASIPRTTEETLFIPTLLARICEHYGYTSMPAKLTANAIASLKDTRDEPLHSGPTTAELLALIMDRISPLSADEGVAFVRLVQLPNKLNLDYLLTVYFSEWGNVCPIVNKNVFLRNYPRITATLENRYAPPAEFCYEQIEKLAATTVLVVALALLSMRSAYSPKNPDDLAAYQASVHMYDRWIHEFIKPNCILTRHCSIESLQILALALQYCLATGDFTTCYELRGRVITMAQQLRLHRCPAAVLGLSREMNDRNLQNFMQAERRILFWCVYSLDAYASLNLGVPRLLKDYEIECAMPFSGKSGDDERDNENILVINNTRLTIFGKVSQLALSVMQFTKVLGNIMDSVFSRSGTDSQERAIERDRVLDCWRRDLPSELKFEIDVNGFSLKNTSKLNDGADGTNWGVYSKPQVILIFLYYHAKILIYLPVISKYGYNHNVGLSMKEQLSRQDGDVSTIMSSMSSVQQSAIQILELLRSMANASGYILPVATNVSREHARFSLLVAKGSLDYIKGGPLHQHSKQLLLDTIALFKQETELGVPSVLSRNSASILEYSLLSILGLSFKTSSNLRKKIINNSAKPRGFEVDERRVGDRSRTGSPAVPEIKSEPSKTPFVLDGFDGADDLAELLQFDPFSINYKEIPDEFVTDGSLGLVPFLEESPESVEDDRLSDRVDSDGAFYLR